MPAKRKKKLARSSGPQYGAVSMIDRFVNHTYRDQRDVDVNKRYRVDLMDGKSMFFRTLEKARKFVFRRQNAAARKNTVDGMLEVDNFIPTTSWKTGLPVTQAPYPAIQRRSKQPKATSERNENPLMVRVIQEEEKPYKGILQRIDEIETQVAQLLVQMDGLYKEAAMVRKALLGTK